MYIYVSKNEYNFPMLDLIFFRNPNYPSTFTTPTSATDCAYTINKISDNICQLRLDFQTLEIGQTIGTGACTDTFQPTVSVDSSST